MWMKFILITAETIKIVNLSLTISTNDGIMDPLHPAGGNLVPREPVLHVTVIVDQLTTTELLTMDLPDSSNLSGTVTRQEGILNLD